eukprot:997395-Rhodomonas_salina.1
MSVGGPAYRVHRFDAKRHDLCRRAARHFMARGNGCQFMKRSDGSSWNEETRGQLPCESM